MYYIIWYTNIYIINIVTYANIYVHINVGDDSGNIPDPLNEYNWISERKDNSNDSSDELHHLGINRQQAKYPDLAVADRRKATLLTYPYENGRVDMDSICAAGYFYQGMLLFIHLNR